MIDDNFKDAIFISGNIPSLKNSKVKTSKGIFPSKMVANFLRGYGIKHYSSSKKTVDGYVRRPDTFRPIAMRLKDELSKVDKPYKLQFYFVRKTRSRFDFGNSVEILADVLTAYDVWDDDNCDNFLPFPWVIDNSCYKVDKDNPGVYIKVVKDCENIL
jgi:Holliday junction resolvase RusA-like endonuclease